jgi:hypothetical protein
MEGDSRSKSSSASHSRHNSPSSSMMVDYTGVNGNVNTRSSINQHGNVMSPSAIMTRMRSSSGIVPQMSPTYATGNSISTSHHQYHSGAASPVRQDAAPDVFGPVASMSPSAGSMTPKTLRSRSTRLASSAITGTDDVDPIGLGIRSSSPAGPALDLTSIYATSASSTVSPNPSPHAATRGRNRRKSYLVTDDNDQIATPSSDSCEIGRSAQTVRSRMAPAPVGDRRHRTTTALAQHSPSVSPTRTASPGSRPSSSRHVEAENAERPKTPERDEDDRDSGISRIRAGASVDTGLDNLSRETISLNDPSSSATIRRVNQSADVTLVAGSGVSANAGLTVASPRKGKARDYGDR